VAQQGLSDYSQLVWGLVELYACWTQGRTTEAPQVLQRLLTTAGQCGIHGLDTFHRLLACDALLAAGRLDEAEALLAEARRHMLPTQLTEVWHAGMQSAWLAGWRGDAQAMLKESRAAINAARAIRSPLCEAYGWIAQALAHRLRGSAADVAATLATLEPLAARAGSAMVDFHLHDLRAWWSRTRGDAQAEAAALTQALPCASRHGMLLPALGCDAALAETASAALAHGIDPDFVRGWIARRGLPPPAVADLAPDWPHPVRIRLLGGFELVLDGVPLQFDGKVQKRPLELLQALAAHGPEPVPVTRLTDDVWPEQDGDAARKSFDVALHRLRKLLGEHAGVLRLEAGALHLDTVRIGCDLWDLRRLAELSAPALAARTAAAAWARDQARAPLLPTQEATWCQTLRARHARRMQARFDHAAQL
jgi:LuxR family transcriptional regulator, maltose regulon positive regulatory protein